MMLDYALGPRYIDRSYPLQDFEMQICIEICPQDSRKARIKIKAYDIENTSDVKLIIANVDFHNVQDRQTDYI